MAWGSTYIIVHFTTGYVLQSPGAPYFQTHQHPFSFDANNRITQFNISGETTFTLYCNPLSISDSTHYSAALLNLITLTDTSLTKYGKQWDLFIPIIQTTSPRTQGVTKRISFIETLDSYHEEYVSITYPLETTLMGTLSQGYLGQSTISNQTFVATNKPLKVTFQPNYNGSTSHYVDTTSTTNTFLKQNDITNPEYFDYLIRIFYPPYTHSYQVLNKRFISTRYIVFGEGGGQVDISLSNTDPFKFVVDSDNAIYKVQTYN